MAKNLPSAVPVAVDKFKYLEILAKALDGAKRHGKEIDVPEGSRYIILSDTLARQMSKDLRDIHDQLSGKILIA